MAHRCWAVDEIVRAIVSNLVRDEKRASVVALASCSKSLEEPALGELWRSLSSLAPLVKCFPPEVWEIRGKEGKLYFKRAPLEAEWLRFRMRYASKVRYYYLREYCGDSFFCLSSSAFHLLQLYSLHGPLFPNLISLEWFHETTSLPFISLFISSSLTSIVIDIPSKASLMLPPILKRLSQLSPNLREIEIDSDQYLLDTSMEEASSQLLINCNRRLRKFRVCSPISASALRHIIQLPSLEEFLLVINSFQLPDPLPIHVFPSLRKLEAICNGDPTWLKLLLVIEGLTVISITCPGSDVEQFMEALEQIPTCRVHETLQEFTLESPENFQITPQIIARNLSFKNLTTLILRSECLDHCQTSDLTDDDVDLLTKAMPCLESLALGDCPCEHPSQITFKSLYTISRRCTRLDHLEIHFNPALFVAKLGMEFKSWDVALGLPHVENLSSFSCRIKMVFVGYIPFPAQSHASSILALGLLGVFPCLEDVEYGNDDWSDVAHLVRVFRNMGCRLPTASGGC